METVNSIWTKNIESLAKEIEKLNDEQTSQNYWIKHCIKKRGNYLDYIITIEQIGYDIWSRDDVDEIDDIITKIYGDYGFLKYSPNKDSIVYEYCETHKINKEGKK